MQVTLHVKTSRDFNMVGVIGPVEDLEADDENAEQMTIDAFTEEEDTEANDMLGHGHSRVDLDDDLQSVLDHFTEQLLEKATIHAEAGLEINEEI